MTTYNILAIDPAEKTGFAFFNQKDVNYGLQSFKLKRDENFGSKLIRFKTFIEKMIEENEINFISFERPSGHMPAAIMSHAKFVAVMELICTEREIPYCGFSASEIKKSATGKGNANKIDMIAYAKKDFAYKGKDDNEADAIHILNLTFKNLNIDFKIKNNLKKHEC